MRPDHAQTFWRNILCLIAVNGLLTACSTTDWKYRQPEFEKPQTIAPSLTIDDIYANVINLKEIWAREPLPVGNEYQTFYDDVLIQNSSLQRKLGSVEKLNDGNPVIVPTRKWESPVNRQGFGAYSSVLRGQDGIFRAWYGAGRTTFGTLEVGFATSDDGLNWKKPISRSVLTPAAGIGVLYGENEYLMTYTSSPENTTNLAVQFATSKNGFRWRELPEKYSIPATYCKTDTQKSTFWDPAINGHRVSVRNRDRIRGIKHYITTRFDRNFEYLAVHDEIVDPYEIYSFNIHQQYGLYVGKMSLWIDDVYYCVAVSRDGIAWDWTWLDRRHSLIPKGASDRFDSRSIWHCATPFIDMGDSEWIYYMGSRGAGHSGSASLEEDVPYKNTIGVAKIRKGGLFYLTPSAAAGRLSTKKFVLTGDAITFNCDASLGVFSAAITDENGTPYTGFSHDDCTAVTGDTLENTMQWNGNSSIDNLKGKTIRLDLNLTGPVKLYGFQVVNTEAEL